MNLKSLWPWSTTEHASPVSAKARVAKASRRTVTGHARPSWYPGVTSAKHHAFIPPEVELATYREMRRYFPVLDSAAKKLTRLVGVPTLKGDDKIVAEMNDWMKRIQVNQRQRGLPTWLRIHTDQMLVYGKGVGEMVPNKARNDLFAITNIDPVTIKLAADEHPLSVRMFQLHAGPPFEVELPKEWILMSLNAQDGDNPHGASLFRSLPFVAELLSIIENALGQAWERMGAPSFHVNWEPPANFNDPDATFAEEFLGQISAEFQAAMTARRSGDIHDFVSGGKIDVTTIGADGTPLPLQEPFRALAEQLVAATGLPPWLLGLSWSSTERLSSVQADLLIQDIGNLRDQVQPQVETLLETRQRLTGAKGTWELTWPPVTLDDAVETAKAAVLDAQAKSRAIENEARMWALGYKTQEQAMQATDPDLKTVARKMAVPPAQGTPGGTARTSAPRPRNWGWHNPGSQATNPTNGLNLDPGVSLTDGK